MKLLGIESSCDETSAAVIETIGSTNDLRISSNIISSSAMLHAKTGGIVPEIAAREQIKAILPIIEESLSQANLEFDNPDIDAIALTVGPGLIGSLLVGVETTKTLSMIWNRPIIPVNHLLGHIYANFIIDQKNKPSEINFPAIGLVISGGHTDLLLMESHGKYRWIGGTHDDAAGEAFDKIGRMLDLPYPAGPIIEGLAKKGDPLRFKFPRPLIYEKSLNFSFSGLKTAVFREVQKTRITQQTKCDISFAVQDSISSVIAIKTANAAIKYKASSVLVGGGVAANDTIIKTLTLECRKRNPDLKVFVPSKKLCTDNAAMIAAAGFYLNKTQPIEKISANPSLYF